MRREVFLKVINDMPGISYNEIARNTNLSNGVVSHYILQLMESNELEKEGKTRSKYFIRNVPVKDRKLIMILRNKTNNKICKLLLEKNLILGSNEISNKINKSKSTISVSLKSLQKSKIVEREIMNKNSKLTNDIGYKINNHHFFKNFLSKYNL